MKYRRTENATEKHPTEFRLYQNEPNPFSDTTTIRLALPRTSHVRLTVFDREHKLVATLLDKTVPAGHHTIIWDGTAEDGDRVANGGYNYRLEANGFVASRQLQLRGK